MLNKLRSASLISLVLLISYLALPLNTRAATDSRPEIVVAPFLQNVQIGSEATKSFDITFANDSDRTQKLALSVADFGSLDQTGGVAFVGSDFSQLLDKYTLSPWLNLSTQEITLASRHKATVTATISNNPGMGPGGHYAAVVATVVSADGSAKNQVNLKQKISSLVFAVKTGGEKYDLRLEKIDNDGGLFHLPNEVYLTMKATGNTHVVPRGVVYLKDNSGQVLSRGIINQQSGSILPDTNRVYTVKLNKLSAADFWKTGFYIQVDYRYDGLNVFARKKAGLHYLNPQIIALFMLLVATGVVARRLKATKKSQKLAAKSPRTKS